MAGFSGQAPVNGYTKQQVDELIAQSMAKTRLHAGTTDPNSGTVYQLSESIANYEYVLIKCITNTEIQSQIFVSSMLLETNRKAQFVAVLNGTDDGLVSDFGLMAYCTISFASNGASFTVTGGWKNVNYKIKPSEIYGIRHI